MNESAVVASLAAAGDLRREGKEEGEDAAEHALLDEGMAVLSEIDLTSKSTTTTESVIFAAASKTDSHIPGTRTTTAKLEAEVEQSVNSISNPVSDPAKDSILRLGESDANSTHRRRRSISLPGDSSRSMGSSQPETAKGKEEERALNPEFLYSTMVSDVRQTCPIHGLSHLIKNSTTTASVHRYVITGGPSTSVSSRH